MKVNPFTIIPTKARRWIYLGVVVGGMGFGAWQAAEGNVVVAIGSFLISVESAMAASNTTDGASR